MSIHGVLLIDILALGYIVVILDLIRRQRLAIGYALLWLAAVVSLMTLVSFSPLRDWITNMVGATYPASALSLLAFGFMFVVLIYFSVQLSILSARQVELIQAITLLELSLKERDGVPQTPGEAGEALPWLVGANQVTGIPPAFNPTDGNVNRVEPAPLSSSDA
jgi:hypothetical protein